MASSFFQNTIINQFNVDTNTGDKAARDHDRQQVVVGALKLAPIPELNNIIPVPSEFLYKTEPGESYYHPDFIPTEMTSSDGDFYTTKTYFVDRLGAARPADPMRGLGHTSHFLGAKSYTAQRLAAPQEEEAKSYAFCRARNISPGVVRRGRVDRANKVGVNWRSGFEDIGHLFSGQLDPARVRDADNAISWYRWGGVNGSRLTPGHESGLNGRILGFRALATKDLAGQSYLAFFVELLSMRLEQQAAPYLLSAGYTVNPRPRHTPDPSNANTLPGRATVKCINAVLPANTLPNQGYNPEANFTEADQEAVAQGRMALIDAQDMSDEELRCVIRAMGGTRRTWGNRYSSPAGTGDYENIFNYRGVAANGDHPFIEHFILHFGRNPIPDDVVVPVPAPDTGYRNYRFLGRDIRAVPNDDPTRSPWYSLPTIDCIDRVIRRFCTMHHCWGDYERALDIVNYHFFHYQLSYNALPIDQRPHDGADPAYRLQLLNGFGGRNMKLPQILTMPAYFDRFREQMDAAPSAGIRMERYMALPGPEAVRHSWYCCHTIAASINWPSTAFTLNGRVLSRMHQLRLPQVPPAAAGTAQTVLNHSYFYGRTLRSDQINAWAASHASATFLMYHFRPRNTTWEVTEQAPRPAWNNANSAFLIHPYLELWMCKMLPTYLILPLPDQKASWPESEPRPVNNVGQVRPHVRLAAMLERFTGRPWVQDKGMERNANFYLSALYDRDPNPAAPTDYTNFRIGWWNTPFQSEPPTAPVYYTPQFMPFAGSMFLAPGSTMSYSITRNRELSLSCSVESGDANLLTRANENWFTLTSGTEYKGTGVVYINPLQINRQRPPIPDYSLLFMADRETMTFSGISIRKGTEIRDVPNQPSRVPTYLNTTTTHWPSQLANHNPGPTNPPPKLGKGGMKLPGYRAVVAAARRGKGADVSGSGRDRRAGSRHTSVTSGSSRSTPSFYMDKRRAPATPGPEYRPKNPNFEEQLRSKLAGQTTGILKRIPGGKGEMSGALPAPKPVRHTKPRWLDDVEQELKSGGELPKDPTPPPVTPAARYQTAPIEQPAPESGARGGEEKGKGEERRPETPAFFKTDLKGLERSTTQRLDEYERPSDEWYEAQDLGMTLEEYKVHKEKRAAYDATQRAQPRRNYKRPSVADASPTPEEASKTKKPPTPPPISSLFKAKGKTLASPTHSVGSSAIFGGHYHRQPAGEEFEFNDGAAGEVQERFWAGKKERGKHAGDWGGSPMPGAFEPAENWW